MLTEADRNAILKKLHELKIDKVKSEMSLAPMNDGWSTLLCIGSHCVDGGAGAQMSERDKAIFSDAYYYLEGVAAEKRKRG